MDDDLLAKLTRSPLEEPDEPSERRWRRREPQEQQYAREAKAGSPAVLIGAVLAGGLLVLGGWALAGGGDEEAPATTVPPPPTPVAATVPAPVAVSELPDGYAEVNERLGVRPERILQRDDLLFVSLTTAVRSGLDAGGTAGFSGGRWELEVADGRRFEAVDEVFDPLVPGAFTVVFPVDAYAATDAASLHLTGEAVRTSATHDMTVATEGGFPWNGTPEDARIALDTGLELVAGEMDLDDETGILRWELVGPEEFTAQVSASADVWGDANSQFPLGSMSPAGGGIFPLLLGGAPGSADLGRTGQVDLVTGRLRRGDVVSRVDIDWIVDWVAYVPAEAVVPLAGAEVAVSG